MDDQTKKDIQERLAQLPKVVRDAITSADLEKRLRELADGRKLHLDQWQRLENEVVLALLGFEKPENLEGNIKKELGLTDDDAAALTLDIGRVVFEPIREELERELEHPEAKAKEVSAVEQVRQQALENRQQVKGATPDAVQTPAPKAQMAPVMPTPPAQPAASPPSLPIQPATPPPPPPTEKAARAPASGAYKPGEPSIARKDIHDDPYREPPA